jgi:deoxyribodipyrimidine photolyase
MWLSASAYFHQYFRVYSPVQFGKKFDPNGNFIRHFCPELKDFPKQFIYQVSPLISVRLLHHPSAFVCYTLTFVFPSCF